jgi:hypothetical protein
MEIDCSLSCSQEPATGLSLMNTAHTNPTCFLKIHFDVILPYMPRFSKWCFSIRLLDKVCYVFLIARMLATCLAYPPWLDISNNIWWWISVSLCNVLQLFILFRSVFSPQLPVPCPSLTVRDKSQTHTKQHKIMVLNILNFTFCSGRRSILN